jgi:hypothetical protein
VRHKESTQQDGMLYWIAFGHKQIEAQPKQADDDGELVRYGEARE